jgi:hypothetical protein
VAVAQRFRAKLRGLVVDRAIQTSGVSAFGHRALKVFRTQQRPDEIGQHEGGGGTAENEIQHGSNLSAKGDESDQRGEDHHGVDNRNHVAHGARSPDAVWDVAAAAR